MTTEPKQPVAISGEVVGELLARVEVADDAVAALRQRLADIDLAYSAAEDLAAPPMSEGHIGKLLAPAGVRSLTVAALLRVGEICGLRLLIIVDEKLTRKMQPLWTKRDARMVHTKRLPPKIGAVQTRRFMPAIASAMGARGGKARQAALSPEQRRELGLRGAAARWSHRASRAAARTDLNSPRS
jgi:hypothetical protein